jgi:hypothetical protein
MLCAHTVSRRRPGSFEEFRKGRVAEAVSTSPGG